jgi:hypothetical protein
MPANKRLRPTSSSAGCFRERAGARRGLDRVSRPRIGVNGRVQDRSGCNEFGIPKLNGYVIAFGQDIETCAGQHQ